MIITLLTTLYFVLLFGFFEIFMFKRGVALTFAYWHRPFTTAVYFLTATALALVIFSSVPLQLVLESSVYGIVSVLLLYCILIVLASYGWFTLDGDTITRSTKARKESFSYIFAKSTDILFQDAMAVIVLLSFQAFLANNTLTIVAFSVYFFLAHLLLLIVLPIRFASIFAFASLFAGLAFACIVLYDLGVVYIFILHWAFYAATYSLIKKVRKKEFQVSQSF